MNNRRPRILPLFLCFLFCLPTQAQSTQKQYDYLNQEFAQKAWPAVTDLVKNMMVHTLISQVESTDMGPLNAKVSNIQADLSGIPKFFPNQNDLTALFPATGKFKLKVDVVIETPLVTDPTAEIEVDLAIVLKAGEKEAIFDHIADIRVDIHATQTWMEIAALSFLTLGGSATLALVVPALIIAEYVFESEIKSKIDEDIEKELKKNLGMLQTILFDPKAPITYATPDRELLSGPTHPDLSKNTVNILIVADGYTPAMLSKFIKSTDDMTAALLEENPKGSDLLQPVSEPFRSFRKAIRVERLNLEVPKVTETSQRILASFYDKNSNSQKLSINNISRLARIGIQANELGADVIVILGNPHSLPATVRANAFGNLVLMVGGKDAPSTFLHELGHTVLGRLADEYVEKTDTVYRGQEPINVNVSKSKTSKWNFWATHPGKLLPWDKVTSGHVGAYTFGKGIHRPSSRCKMRDKSKPFCAVCREAITRGILDLQKTNPKGGHFIAIEPNYLNPWTQKGPAVLLRSKNPKALSTPGCGLQAFPGEVDTHIDLQLSAASLPEPWSLKWKHTRKGQLITQKKGTQPGLFKVRLGDQIQVTMSSGCLFVPQDTLSNLVFTFRVDKPKPFDAPLLPPTNLSQSVSKGTQHPIQFDPKTGHPISPVTLSATPGQIPGWKNIPLGVEFKVQRAGSQSALSKSMMSAGGQEISYPVDPLTPGEYRWYARTFYQKDKYYKDTSQWVSLPLQFWHKAHFILTPPQFQSQPVAPHTPVDLEAKLLQGTGGSAPTPPSLQFSAESWDMNGDDLRLEFQIERFISSKSTQGGGSSRQQYDPAGKTSLKTSMLQPASVALLRVRGTVAVIPWGKGLYRWRVRAVDSTGRSSNWAQGNPLWAKPHLGNGNNLFIQKKKFSIPNIGPVSQNLKQQAPRPQLTKSAQKPSLQKKTFHKNPIQKTFQNRSVQKNHFQMKNVPMKGASFQPAFSR